MRTEKQYGNVYDHFAIVFEYGDGRRGYHFSRQQKGCDRAYVVDMMGDQELQQFMQIQRRRIDAMLNQLPTHQAFINRYCPTATA